MDEKDASSTHEREEGASTAAPDVLAPEPHPAASSQRSTLEEELSAWIEPPRITRTFLKKLSGVETDLKKSKPASPSETSPPPRKKRRSEFTGVSSPPQIGAAGSLPPGTAAGSPQPPTIAARPISTERPVTNNKKRKHHLLNLAANTVVPVQSLPDIYNRLLKAIPDERMQFLDIYEIQNYIVNCAIDEQFEGEDAAQKIFEHVLSLATTDAKKLAKYHKNRRNGCTDIDELIERRKRDLDVVKRYIAYVNSEEEQKKRSFKRINHQWTKQQIEKFHEAYKIWGSGPQSNRKIAEYIGEGVHPNHVAYLKQILKKEKGLKRMDDYYRLEEAQKAEGEKEKEKEKEKETENTNHVGDEETTPPHHNGGSHGRDGESGGSVQEGDATERQNSGKQDQNTATMPMAYEKDSSPQQSEPMSVEPRTQPALTGSV